MRMGLVSGLFFGRCRLCDPEMHPTLQLTAMVCAEGPPVQHQGQPHNMHGEQWVTSPNRPSLAQPLEPGPLQGSGSDFAHHHVDARVVCESLFCRFPRATTKRAQGISLEPHQHKITSCTLPKQRAKPCQWPCKCKSHVATPTTATEAAAATTTRTNPIPSPQSQQQQHFKRKSKSKATTTTNNKDDAPCTELLVGWHTPLPKTCLEALASCTFVGYSVHERAHNSCCK